MTEKEWIELIAEDAQRAANMYGYLPSVLIAQTCQETGYGSTDLSQEGIYNTVGMKVDLLNDTWTSMYWNGDIYGKESPEWYGDKKIYKFSEFRKYPSYFCGLADFCQFLHDAKLDSGKYKYRDLLGERDPYTLIEGVRSRGYCTDPSYSMAIMRIIEKHNLTQYDTKEARKTMERPEIIDRIAENAGEVPAHNANSHEYLAIHYLGVNGENPDLYGGGYGGHFYVSKDGTCYQAAKVTDKLWHVGASSGFRYIHPHARNSNTIGIECATYSIGDRWFFTQATQEACARLAAWIMQEYDIPMENLLRHGDITTKHCPSPYIDNPGDGPNWTWEQFREKVAEYLNGAEQFEVVRKIVADGQRAVNAFLAGSGYESLKIDGVFGPKTQKAGYAVLQKTMNLDYNINLKIDGIPGPLTKGELEGHYIRYGEEQWLVTYAEIACMLRGRDPAGIEKPGRFGDGLTAALGGVTYLDADALIKLLE